jgi:hypothetical protein
MKYVKQIFSYLKSFFGPKTLPSKKENIAISHCLGVKGILKEIVHEKNYDIYVFEKLDWIKQPSNTINGVLKYRPSTPMEIYGNKIRILKEDKWIHETKIC